MNPKSKIPEPMKKPILLYLTTLALTALCGGAAAGQAAAQSAPDMSKYILTPKPADTPPASSASARVRNSSTRSPRRASVR